MTKQPEARVSAKIQEHFKQHGVWCFKVHGSEYQPAGIPDIVGAYKGQFIACETKMPDGELSAIQRFRIARIRHAGGLVVVAYSFADAQQFLFHVMQWHDPDQRPARAHDCHYRLGTYDEKGDKACGDR